MRILVAIGTRPEIIKLAPVVHALCELPGTEVRTVATGQHHDPSLIDVLRGRLALRLDATWCLDGGEAQRLGTMLTMAFEEVQASRPTIVVVLGDTYTVPVFCLAARRHGVPVVHLEAGIRSFNARSMEEVNRRTAAALASLHFAPTALAARFLADEGVATERIRVVGNPVIDVLRQTGVTGLAPERRAGVVVTAHRATNVDDPVRLAQLVALLTGLAEELGPVTFPMHPRTAARLEQAGALESLRRVPGLTLLDPLPYREMLDLIARSRVVVTDSGGLQEEAAWLGTPVVVLRSSTPRWEGVQARTSVLTGLDAERALDAARRFATPEEQRRVFAAPCPYGDGRTSQRVAETLADPLVAPLLALEEPDLRQSGVPA
jgi:UDP-N-acetylglucosamine 2-epimerase (non-hydrolysing)